MSSRSLRSLTAECPAAERLPARPAEPWLVTLEEAARRVGLARKTLYEWKRTGKLRREHGLRMLGPRAPRLEWAVFKDCIDKGEL